MLLPKPDKTFYICSDYMIVNNVNKTGSFPVQKIYPIGNAKYVTPFDLLKGFIQIPVT